MPLETMGEEINNGIWGTPFFRMLKWIPAIAIIVVMLWGYYVFVVLICLLQMDNLWGKVYTLNQNHCPDLHICTRTYYYFRFFMLINMFNYYRFLHLSCTTCHLFSSSGHTLKL